MADYNQKIIDILGKNNLTISSIEFGTDGLVSSMLSLSDNSKQVYVSGVVFNNIDSLQNYFGIKVEEEQKIVNDICGLTNRKFKTDCCICTYKSELHLYIGVILIDKIYVSKINFDNRTLSAASALVYLSNLLKGMDK
jgi:hypothetical protein